MLKNIMFICLFISFFSFSAKKSTEKKEMENKNLIDIIEKNKDFVCNPTKKTFKIEGENFIGHFDYSGKPYGEWSLKDGSIRQCFLEDEETTDYKGNYFYKKTPSFNLRISYSGNIYVVDIKKGNDVKGYFFEKYEDKYVYRELFYLHLNLIKPLYENMIIKL